MVKSVQMPGTNKTTKRGDNQSKIRIKSKLVKDNGKQINSKRRQKYITRNDIVFADVGRVTCRSYDTLAIRPLLNSIHRNARNRHFFSLYSLTVSPK